jgi:hypothetical protein
VLARSAACIVSLTNPRSSSWQCRIAARASLEDIGSSLVMIIADLLRRIVSRADRRCQQRPLVFTEVDRNRNGSLTGASPSSGNVDRLHRLYGSPLMIDSAR